MKFASFLNLYFVLIFFPLFSVFEIDAFFISACLQTCLEVLYDPNNISNWTNFYVSSYFWFVFLRIDVVYSTPPTIRWGLLFFKSLCAAKGVCPTKGSFEHNIQSLFFFLFHSELFFASVLQFWFLLGVLIVDPPHPKDQSKDLYKDWR